MKAILTVLIAIILGVFSAGQEKIVEKKINTKTNTELDLNFKFADDIQINTWNKNEVFVKVSVNINDNKDNDAFKIETETSGNKIIIKSDIENMDEICMNEYKLEKDEDGNCVVNNCHLELDLNFEVFIPNGTSILSIETINGNIILNEVESEMEIKTITGFIDYTINQNANFCITMKTITGEFFTDLDLKIEGDKDKVTHLAGQEIKASLNRGGTNLNLETISGNVYLRRK